MLTFLVNNRAIDLQ